MCFSKYDSSSLCKWTIRFRTFLPDGPKWHQVTSHGVRNYYEKDQLQQEGTPCFLHTQKTLLSKGSLKMESFYQTVSQLNCFCYDPWWRHVASVDPHNSVNKVGHNSVNSPKKLRKGRVHGTKDFIIEIVLSSTIRCTKTGKRCIISRN